MRHFVALSGFFLTVLSLSPTPAHANFVNGNGLYDDCKSDKTDSLYHVKQSACLSYIQGIVDGVDLENNYHKSERYYCLPKNVTMGQIRDVVAQFLESNPAKRHLPAAILVVVSLEEVFPCPSSKEIKK